MFLLDTNVVSRLRCRDRTDPQLRDWINARQKPELFISVVTVLEIELGALRLARKDPAQAATLKHWPHGDILPNFATRTLSIDTAIALRRAALHTPDPKSECDAPRRASSTACRS